MTEAAPSGAENEMPDGSHKKAGHDRNIVDVHVGHRIRKRRLMLRMTQTALAERLGVSFQAVQKWEGGDVRMTIALLLRIAWALDVPLAYFLQGLPLDKAVGSQIDDGRWLVAGSRSRSTRVRTEEALMLRAIGPLMELPPKIRDEVVSHIRGLLRALDKEWGVRVSIWRSHIVDRFSTSPGQNCTGAVPDAAPLATVAACRYSRADRTRSNFSTSTMIGRPFSLALPLPRTTERIGYRVSAGAPSTCVHTVEPLISQSRGSDGWDYLPNDTRRWLGPLRRQLPHQFWVHQDSASREVSRRLGAAGFACGNRIFLGDVPSEQVENVLRHELVHLAQAQLALHTGAIASGSAIEHEAEFISGLSVARPVQYGADPEALHPILWFVAIGVGLYILLRPSTANAPGPQDQTLPSPSPGQIIAESLCLFVVPGGAMGLGGRLGLGLLGRSALAGAATTTSLRLTGDVARGEPSPPLMYVFDAVTGAAIGWVVPGGVRLIGKAGTYAFDRLDALAAYGFSRSSLVVMKAMATAQAAATKPLELAEARQFLRAQGLAEQVSQWWLERRHQVILFRGQTIATTSIESPLTRWEGVVASEQLLAELRSRGLSDVDIASWTARYHTEGIPRESAPPPGMEGQRLGAAGIPTTGLPGIAADFARSAGGVVYVIRVPRDLAIRPIPWPLLEAEDEHIIFNRLPRGSVVQVIPANEIPALMVDGNGKLVPSR